MSERKLCTQLLLFHALLTLSVATKIHQLAGEGDAASFLQLTAKIAHHASDADDTRVQLGASVESTHGHFQSPETSNTSTPAVRIFCYAIACPTDKTVKQLRQQMEGCDAYKVFAYYANAEENTEQLFKPEEMQVGTTKGWADNARLMPRVFQRIIDSELPEYFTWFVKLDSDTFFRPRFLYPILAKYNASVPMALGTDKDRAVWHPEKPPVLRGSMETFSYKVFRHENTSMLLDMNRTGGEDNVISEQMLKAGMEIIVNDKVENCNTMFLDYDNIRRENPEEVGTPDQFNLSVIPDVVREFFAVPELIGKQLPEAIASTPNCVHRNFVIAHPIKDVQTYEELQALDRRNQSA